MSDTKTTKHISVRLDKKVAEDLEEICKVTGIRLSKLIEKACIAFLIARGDAIFTAYKLGRGKHARPWETE